MAKEQIQKIKQITLGLKDIKLLEFKTTSYTDELKHDVASDKIEFQCEYKATPVEAEKLFNTVFTITITEKSHEDNRIKLGELKVFNSFIVTNFGELVKKLHGTNILIADDLIRLTADISLGTARGMLVLKVAETKIKNAIIPLINPNSFIPNKNIENQKK